MGMFDDLVKSKGMFDDLLAQNPPEPLELEKFEGPVEVVLLMQHLKCSCGAEHKFPKLDNSLARYRKFHRQGFGWRFVGFELLPCTKDFDVPYTVEWEELQCSCCQDCHGQPKPKPHKDPLELWRQALACCVPLDPETRHRLELKAASREALSEASEFEKALIALYIRRTGEAGGDL